MILYNAIRLIYDMYNKIRLIYDMYNKIRLIYDMYHEIRLIHDQVPAHCTLQKGQSGIFKNITVSGARFSVTSTGIQIMPLQSDVTVTYSTKTCAEFYRMYGRAYPQVPCAHVYVCMKVCMYICM
jgi:hypothetical protein